MENNSMKFSHASPVFAVINIQETINFYCNQLGFSSEFEWGNPVDYAVLLRDGVKIHFSQLDKESTSPIAKDTRVLIIFVYDVNEIYKEIAGKKVNITKEIDDRNYGMRDFDVMDNNG